MSASESRACAAMRYRAPLLRPSKTATRMVVLHAWLAPPPSPRSNHRPWMSVQRVSSEDEDEQALATRAAPHRLVMRQRLALVIGTGLTAERAMAMDDAELNYQFFLDSNVRAPLLKAARISPTQLKARGVRTARQFRALEFSALDLVDGPFCAACVAAYGADDLIAEFLTTASDAVVLAGSPAVHQLGLDVGTLLVMCAQQPRMAFEVLAQTTPRGACLSGVAPQTLLETGLTVRQLRDLGYTREALAAQTCAGDVELGALGF